MDTLTVKEYLGNTLKKRINNAVRRQNYSVNVDISTLTIGQHSIKIEVSNGNGGSATRTFTFTKTNAAPVITGTDQNPGDKNLGFAINYQVSDADNDTLIVKEKLNGTITKTLNNAPKN